MIQLKKKQMSLIQFLRLKLGNVIGLGVVSYLNSIL